MVGVEGSAQSSTQRWWASLEEGDLVHVLSSPVGCDKVLLTCMEPVGSAAGGVGFTLQCCSSDSHLIGVISSRQAGTRSWSLLQYKGGKESAPADPAQLSLSMRSWGLCCFRWLKAHMDWLQKPELMWASSDDAPVLFLVIYVCSCFGNFFVGLSYYGALSRRWI